MQRRASDLVVLLRAVGWLPTVVLLIVAQGGAGSPAITPSAVQLVATSQTRDAPGVFEHLPPSAETPEGTATDVQMLIRAVVHIQTSDGAGSGAVVAEGKILTAAHVVGDAVKLSARKELAAIEAPEERKEAYDRKVAQGYETARAINSGARYVIDPADTRAWIVRGLKSLPPTPPRTGKKRPYVDTW